MYILSTTGGVVKAGNIINIKEMFAFWFIGVCLFLSGSFLCNPPVDYELTDLGGWGEPRQPSRVNVVCVRACFCVYQSMCACMLIALCQSKPPSGSLSHQLLIKLVSHSSTSVDAGDCVDLYIVSAVYRIVVCESRASVGICACVCLQSSTYSWGRVSLITSTWQLKLQPPQLTAPTCICNRIHLTSSPVFSLCLHIFFLSLSPFTSHTSSASLFLCCFPVCWPCFMVVWLNWCFFLFFHARHSMPDHLQTHIFSNTQEVI